MTAFQPIATARLTLRRLRADDRSRLIWLANNWNVAKNLSTMPYPYNGKAADHWLGKQDELWQSGRNGPLAIALSDELIGGIGVGVRDGDDWELGYWLGEPYWGRGYASEAARALCAYAFSTLALRQIVAGHYAENHASGRVLTKLGFRYIGEVQRYCLARGSDVKCLEMTLSEERWKAGLAH